MLNDRVGYGKRSFRSCQHDRVVHFKQWEKTSNLNGRVDHGK